MAVVLVAGGQLLKLSRDVISSTGVSIPIGIDTIGVHRSTGNLLMFEAGEVGVEALPVAGHRVTKFLAELALDGGLVVVVAATTLAALVGVVAVAAAMVGVVAATTIVVGEVTAATVTTTTSSSTAETTTAAAA